MVNQITVFQSSTISHNNSASYKIQLPAYSGVGRNTFAFLVFELLGANLDLSLPTSDCAFKSFGDFLIFQTRQPTRSELQSSRLKINFSA